MYKIEDITDIALKDKIEKVGTVFGYLYSISCPSNLLLLPYPYTISLLPYPITKLILRM